MNQKYIITRNDTNTELTIAEHAEVDKDTFALLCEETFPLADIQSASEAGQDAVITAFRSKHLYPPQESSHRIAETVIAFMADESITTVEVGFDDKIAMREALEAESELAGTSENNGDEEAIIDDLLKDIPAVPGTEKAVAKETSGEKEDN